MEINETEEQLNDDLSMQPKLSPTQEGVNKIRAELAKVIVGQEELIESLLIGVVANGHCLIEGVPGIAKTLSARLLAKTMNVGYSRIQFTPDLMPSDVLGTSIFNPKTTQFEFKEGPIFSNVILIDEINRAPAKTQSALFEVMEEKQVTADGSTYQMSDPFIVFATQNPIEQEGTYRLPEAQLDRFLMKIEMHFPELHEELKIIAQHNARHEADAANEVEKIISAKEVKQLQQTAAEVRVEPSIQEYIAKLVVMTRNHPMLYLGASPRGSISMLKAAKALAAIQGRDFVIPEDVKKVAIPTMRHRVIVSPEKEMEGITPDMIISELIEQVEIPR